MTIERIIRFAKDNNLESFELPLAANEIDKSELHEKLTKHRGKYYFTDESSFPYLICNCFDEIIEVRVDSLYFDNDGHTIICCTDTENHETYELTENDFVIGQLKLIVNVII